MATTHQLMPGTLVTGLGPESDDLFGIGSTGATSQIAGIPTDEYAIQTQTGNKLTVANTKRATQFLTPRLTGLGWMDTYNVLSNYSAGYTFTPSTVDQVQVRLNDEAVNPATLPCIFMGVILLPPAYKTEQWFRCIITHHFQWKQFRGISYDPLMSNPAYNDWNTVSPTLGSPEEGPIEGAIKNFTGSEDQVDFWVDGVWTAFQTDSDAKISTSYPDRAYEMTVTRSGDKLVAQATYNNNTWTWLPASNGWAISGGGVTSGLVWQDVFPYPNNELMVYINEAIKNGTDLIWDDGE